MTATTHESLQASEIAVGDALPHFELPVTSTVIVAGAIASRDFMPAHHDAEYAKGQGAPDVFMNILTTNGLCARYITDWAGPDAVLESLRIRLGTPNYPGDTMTLYGEVAEREARENEGRLTVRVTGANRLGDHVTGTVVLTLPLGSAR